MTRASRSHAIALGGPRGVGKSTTALALQKIWPSLQVISFSSWLWSFANIKTGKDFAHLPILERYQLRHHVDNDIAEYIHSSQRPKLLDLHYTDFEESERTLIHSEIILDAVDVFVLLDAPAEVIRSRRAADSSSNRSLELEEIERERQSELWGFRKASSERMVPAYHFSECSSRLEIISRLKALFD